MNRTILIQKLLNEAKIFPPNQLPTKHISKPGLLTDKKKIIKKHSAIVLKTAHLALETNFRLQSSQLTVKF